ncbi:MAG TPA: hydrolase, partial [Candidatus Desulfofervidus auxilii]|nr:hydrolase [Candidatus Desulfofervidus auxilii]
ALKRAKNYFNHTFSLHSTYLIGDTPRDIIAGKTIGVKTIAVATGSCSRESLLQFRPDLVLNNLAESQFFDLVLN